jgi:hypothetical protein
VSEERWWTVEEANAALERVAAIVEQARAAAEAARDDAEGLRTRVRGNGHGSPAVDLSGMKEPIDALEAEGIVLRDIEQGLIDFPAKTSAGRAYWLCWVVGEPEVAFWHWPEDGFAGRAPITDLPT